MTDKVRDVEPTLPHDWAEKMAEDLEMQLRTCCAGKTYLEKRELILSVITKARIEGEVLGLEMASALVDKRGLGTITHPQSNEIHQFANGCVTAINSLKPKVR